MVYNVWVRSRQCVNSTAFRSKWWIKILPAIALVLSFSACNDVVPQVLSAEAEQHPIVVAYDASQGTNPYLSDSQVTHQLSSLLFTRLYFLDEKLSPTPQLASSISSYDGNSVYKLSIVEDTFEDGTPITLQDVEASIIAAMGSSRYIERLKNIDVVVIEEDALRITLHEPDAFFPLLLTMPILHASDTSADFPIASGDYGMTGSRLYLRDEANDSDVREIQLVDLSLPGTLTDALNAGTVSLADTTFLPDFVPMSNLGYSVYPTTSMLFIGFSDVGFTTSERRAVSSLIPRTDIIHDIFFNVGFESIGIISPAYDFCDDVELTSSGRVEQEYTLLYNAQTAARDSVVALMTSAFAKEGVTLKTVSADSVEQFDELLLLGEYDLYLGEILLPENLDFSYFFNESSPGYIDNLSQRLSDAYIDMKSTGNTYEFCEVFVEEQPIAPIIFRGGTLYHAEWLTGLTPRNENPYFNFFEVVYD